MFVIGTVKRMLRSPVAVALIASITTAVLVAGISTASIPDNSGVIHGCYKTKGTSHALKVIDNAVTANCPHGYTSLDWDQSSPLDQVFTSSGTYNVPNGVSMIKVEAWGGGGGGGAGDFVSDEEEEDLTAGGGGGGATVVALLPAIAQCAVTVGAGGSGASSVLGAGGVGLNFVPGTNGGATSVECDENANNALTADGGYQSGTSGSTGLGGGSVIGSGAVAISAAAGSGGSYGGACGETYCGGNGGNSGGGSGGGTGAQATGGAGSTGGGGGGTWGSGPATGGAGGNGLVVITPIT